MVFPIKFIIFIYVQILSQDIEFQSNKSRGLPKGLKDRFSYHQESNQAEVLITGKATSSWCQKLEWHIS